MTFLSEPLTISARPAIRLTLSGSDIIVISTFSSLTGEFKGKFTGISALPRVVGCVFVQLPLPRAFENKGPSQLLIQNSEGRDWKDACPTSLAGGTVVEDTCA